LCAKSKVGDDRFSQSYEGLKSWAGSLWETGNRILVLYAIDFLEFLDAHILDDYWQSRDTVGMFKKWTNNRVNLTILAGLDGESALFSAVEKMNEVKTFHIHFSRTEKSEFTRTVSGTTILVTPPVGRQFSYTKAHDEIERSANRDLKASRAFTIVRTQLSSSLYPDSSITDPDDIQEETISATLVGVGTINTWAVPISWITHYRDSKNAWQHCRPWTPEEEGNLRLWVALQHRRHREGKLSPRQIAMLESIEFKGHKWKW